MPTPLMKQYLKIKSRHPEAILLFRMGDFYETFEDDAIKTAKILGITLTKRGGNSEAGDVPLAGFPYHALDAYLPKLLKAGHRVAICEQLEDPKLARGIVKRDVVEVVTPGVAFSDKVLEQKKSNYLASVILPNAVASGKDIVGFSFTDVSTGEFYAGEFPLSELVDYTASLGVSELLIQKRDYDSISSILQRNLSGKYSLPCFTKVEDWIVNYEYGYDLLVNHFATRTLKGFGCEKFEIGIMAAGVVLNYLVETQKDRLTHIVGIKPFETADYMILDRTTLRNLEITTTMMGDSNESTLLSILDQTLTPMGGRLLKIWISRPLKKLDEISKRHNAVEGILLNKEKHVKIRNLLDSVGDLERLIGKICTSRANPRDLISLKEILLIIPNLQESVNDLTPELFNEIAGDLNPLNQLAEEISSALSDHPPVQLSDGNVIRQGYDDQLDEIRKIAQSGKTWIANLQQQERGRTGISSLKVSYNKVFGYYIEITNTHKDKIPLEYIRKQTLTNAERFITPELKEYEEKVLGAEEKMLARESELFNALRESVARCAADIQKNSSAMARLDIICSFAVVARNNKYAKPEMTEDFDLHIKGGRHPVIETLLPPGEDFIPNDTMLDAKQNRVLIITGPNMSGKSSYIRQVGLIVFLAQIGSFIPADRAKLGVVDKIFTRVGASDNIAGGESTFLVEMHEAAYIVNTATEKSLILLDEIGRGTSTFDGISIAWALTEYIHEKIRAKTLFATHYHELNEIAEILDGVSNYRVDVREYGDKVVFLHKVVPGFADHSYGIHVAQLAGFPDTVTERANFILKRLEESGLSLRSVDGDKKVSKEQVRINLRKSGHEIQMPLFEQKDEELRGKIRGVDIDKITPLEALKILADLKEDIK